MTSPSLRKPLILVLCTGNSCRSQMAEAFLRKAVGDLARVESAGSRPSGYVHPLAIRAMEEVGIDLSAHRSKSLNEFLSGTVDAVVTVCGKADQVCPDFPGNPKRFHWPFDDPAEATGDEAGQMAVFRRVRDEIESRFTQGASQLLA